MRRTTIVFFVIVGLSVAIGLFALYGPTRSKPVSGLIGSEKAPFFEDQRVKNALRRHGLEVTVQKAGSREIAGRGDLKSFDFAFPAGVPATEKIQRETGVSKSHNPFFTPMVIASWKPIADLLIQQGVATDQRGYYALDMGKSLALMRDQIRWKDMFLRQGLRPSSTQEPFEDYLVKGMGHSPIVIIYEAQYVAQAAREDGSILPDMVPMYPTPTIFTKHILIPFSVDGEKLGQALETDGELQKLAVEYGFRNNNLTYALQGFFKGQALTTGSSGWLIAMRQARIAWTG